MGDNWGFVAAAYLLAVVMLGGYWRHLARRARALDARRASRGRRP